MCLRFYIYINNALVNYTTISWHCSSGLLPIWLCIRRLLCSIINNLCVFSRNWTHGLHYFIYIYIYIYIKIYLDAAQFDVPFSGRIYRCCLTLVMYGILRLYFVLFFLWLYKIFQLTYLIYLPISCRFVWLALHGSLARYVKLRVAHAPGMSGTFLLTSRVNDPGMNHGTYVTHVPWSMPGSTYSGFLWSLWRGKRSRYSRRMRNPQFYVSGKRPMPVKQRWK